MWLLKEETASAMAQAVKAGLSPTADQCADFIARRAVALSEESSGPGGRILSVKGDTGEIRIEGALTAQPDIMAFIFGGGNTTYPEVLAALDRCQTDATIKKVSLRFNSPGGTMAGLYPVLLAIDSLTKKKTAIASQACSAAYAMAALCGTIEATDPLAEFGSIGVAARFLVDDDLINIASTEAPKKRPDIRTPEGQAVVREYLDQVHEIFAQAIARGRGVTTATVNTTFGRGQTVLAGEAKTNGMIDKIAKPALRPVGGSASRVRAAADQGVADEEPMNLQTLKTDHPEVYAAAALEGQQAAAAALMPPVPAAPTQQITAPGSGAETEKQMDLNAFRAQHPELFASAVREGETKERDRVVAHLTLGEQSGDMKLAIGAIKTGDVMTMTLQAQYMAAGMNRSARGERQTETDAVAGALDGAEAPPSATAMGDKIADLVEQQLGKKKAS